VNGSEEFSSEPPLVTRSGCLQRASRVNVDKSFSNIVGDTAW